MESLPKTCERPCACEMKRHDTRLIVLTGGPGAGKTAVLELVRKVLCEHVAVLPEAASILFGGGFWRLESLTARKAAQRTIFHVQNEMQKLVFDEKKWSMGLCDRGTLDGLAYWPGEKEAFLRELNTSMETEFKKYNAVVHLRSPNLENGYNHQNPLRIESADLAAKIDQRINEAWKAHPNYILIDSTENFIEKVQRATKVIQAFVPECCKQHMDGMGGSK